MMSSRHMMRHIREMSGATLKEEYDTRDDVNRFVLLLMRLRRGVMDGLPAPAAGRRREA